MFDYMELFTRKIIEKMSAEQWYEIIEDQEDGYDISHFNFLVDWVDDNRLWVDLCQYHFDIKVSPKENAKALFKNEQARRQQSLSI